jgi:hypothetical protein
MKNPSSSRKRYRLLFLAWLIPGIALAWFLIGPHAAERNREQLAAEKFDAALTALTLARASVGRSPTPEIRAEQDRLLAEAASNAEASMNIYRTIGSSHSIQAEVLLAIIAVEFGRAFDGLDELLALADLDRAEGGGQWTTNTANIQAAIAETRYRIALMCRAEGDGYENWSKFAEEAAHGFRELASRAGDDTTATERYLTNLAVCTRLIYGGDDPTHSLGFPTRSTQDCARVAQLWKRPPPSGSGSGSGNSGSGDPTPWRNPPPEPNETTVGR